MIRDRKWLAPEGAGGAGAPEGGAGSPTRAGNPTGAGNPNRKKKTPGEASPGGFFHASGRPPWQRIAAHQHAVAPRAPAATQTGPGMRRHRRPGPVFLRT